MRRMIANIFWLGTKELRAFGHDLVLVAFVAWAFSFSIISIARSNLQELHEASIGIFDEDQSVLSRRIAQAFLPPHFKAPQPITGPDIERLMNVGELTFAIDIPPHFQRDLMGSRQPRIQVAVDATAMMQAGIGAGYIQQIVITEINNFLSRSEGAPLPSVNLVVRVAFNPNLTTAWFTSVMAIINNVTMLAIILAGAAIVREREHGTMDHLLVMPINSIRNRHVENLVERFGDHVCGWPLADRRRPRPARCSDRRLSPSVHGRRRDLSVLCNGNRDLSGHRCAIYAATRIALYISCDPLEYVVRKQYAA